MIRCMDAENFNEFYLDPTDPRNWTTTSKSMQFTNSSVSPYDPQAQYCEICASSRTIDSDYDRVPSTSGCPDNVARFQASISLNSSQARSDFGDGPNSAVQQAESSQSPTATCSTLVSTASSLDSPTIPFELDPVTPSFWHSDPVIDSYSLPQSQAVPYTAAESIQTGSTTLGVSLFDLDRGHLSDNDPTTGSEEWSAIPPLETTGRQTTFPSAASDDGVSHPLSSLTPLNEDSMTALQSALNSHVIEPPKSQTSITKTPNTRVLRTASRKSKNRGRTDKPETRLILSGGGEDPRRASRIIRDRDSHNQVEKKYRHRLNEQFLNLLNVLPRILDMDLQKDPTLGGNGGCKFGRDQHNDDVKFSKGQVLDIASRYIQSLKRENEELLKEINGSSQRDLHDADDEVDTLSAKRA